MKLFNLKRKKNNDNENANKHMLDLSCEIAKQDKAIIGYARVGNVTLDSLHLVYNRRMSIIEEGERLIITLYRDEEPAILINAVVTSSTSEHVNITIEKQSELDYVRSTFRTRVFIPGRLYKGDPDEDNSLDIDVMIDDISINGVMMSCTADLTIDDLYTLEFRLPTDILYVPVTIKRAVERQDSVYMKYGGEFCEPNVKQVNTISHFIFQFNTAMRQLQALYSGDYRLFRRAWKTIEEWEKSHHDRKPSMLNRYDRKSITGQNNYFNRKNYNNRANRY